MADDGPLQLALLDEQDLAEISSHDFPGERLVPRRAGHLLITRLAGEAYRRPDPAG
jgi:hypothetical protein